MRPDAAINVFGAAVLVAVAVLGEALPLNGISYAAATEGFAYLVEPAPATRLLWWLFYLVVPVFAVYQSSWKWRDEDVLDQGGMLFGAAFLLEALRIVSVHYRWYVLSLVSALIIPALLIVVYLRLAVSTGVFSGRERFLVDYPVSAFLALSCAQLILTVSLVLYVYGWTGFGAADHAWAVVAVTLLAGLAVFFIVIRRDIVFAAFVFLVLVGVLVGNASVVYVAVSAAVGMGVVALIGTILLVRDVRGGH